MRGWIGVDLDGTLAEYNGSMGVGIGKPLPAMVARVKDWINAGVEVRIFTARASDVSQIALIEKWLVEVGIGGLAITNIKDSNMTALYDDKAVRVCKNTGYVCGGCVRMKKRY